MLFYAWALGLGTVLGLFTRGSQKVFLALAILWAGLATLAGNPLGVLLFELLTGERPRSTRGLPSAQALAQLTERMAPLPSRAIREKADAPLPASALAGDLDAIVAKCLRREPGHRYDTVNALQLDLRRHLAHEPVLAREGARLYVFGRVLRRHR